MISPLGHAYSSSSCQEIFIASLMPYGIVSSFSLMGMQEAACQDYLITCLKVPHFPVISSLDSNGPHSFP